MLHVYILNLNVSFKMLITSNLRISDCNNQSNHRILNSDYFLEIKKLIMCMNLLKEIRKIICILILVVLYDILKINIIIIVKDPNIS